ncbi:hypothetical protein [Microbacterium sp. NPDC079176]|uniref:hypothetical protein n=1 Tax=Microbacterium sp. NPDC079176 TaxID=3154768 RepID=UPI0025F75079|nr:hypothetical protein [uncultured Microbacterium sp.]
MRSPLARCVAASALVVFLVGGASGCAALPSASSPVPTSTASTPDPSPSAADPTPDPSASPEPTQAPADDFGGFASDELAQICIDATLSAFPADVAFTIEDTRIEKRSVTPEWLVLVPAQASGLEAQAQCTIGGSPSAPELGMSSASLEPLPEEQIENLIRGENEGGDR